MNESEKEKEYRMYKKAKEFIENPETRKYLAELTEKSTEYFEKLNMGEDYTKPLSDIEKYVKRIGLPVKKNEIHDFSLELIYDLYKKRIR